MATQSYQKWSSTAAKLIEHRIIDAFGERIANPDIERILILVGDFAEHEKNFFPAKNEGEFDSNEVARVRLLYYSLVLSELLFLTDSVDAKALEITTAFVKGETKSEQF